MEISASSPLYLYCILLGCTPKGRHTEQHDVMFAVAHSVEELYAEMKLFWYRPMVEDVSRAVKKAIPGFDVKTFGSDLLATLSKRDKVHIDAWMKVEYAGGYKIAVRKKTANEQKDAPRLYFVNLGGYKEGEFEEFHKKLFVVATGVTDVVTQLRNHEFMRQFTPPALGTKAKAHFDDKHKIEFDADDIVCVADTISDYEIALERTDSMGENETMIGYVPLEYKLLS